MMKNTSLAEKLRLGVIKDLIQIRNKVYAEKIYGIDVIEIHEIIDNVNALAAIAKDLEMISGQDNK